MPSTCYSIPIRGTPGGRWLWLQETTALPQCSGAWACKGQSISTYFHPWRTRPGARLGTQLPPAGPTFSSTAERLATEENNMLAAKNTGLVIQVASNAENGVFPCSFVSFLSNRPMYKAAWLKQRSPNAWKIGLAYPVSRVEICSYFISFYALIWHTFILHCIIFWRMQP